MSIAEFIKNILSMEIPSASEKLFSRKKYFKPNYFIDIETTYKKKLEILSKFYTKELLPTHAYNWGLSNSGMFVNVFKSTLSLSIPSWPNSLEPVT